MAKAPASKADHEPESTAPAAAAPEPWSIEVEAYRKGFYPEPGSIHGWIRRPGDRFKIKDATAFSREWMVIPHCRPGTGIDLSGTPLDMKGEPIPQMARVEGHGPERVIDDLPPTTAMKIVRDPLQLLNEDALARHEKQLTTRGA